MHLIILDTNDGMEETFTEIQKEEEEEVSLCSFSKDIGLAENKLEITESKSLLGRLKPEKILASDVKRQLVDVKCIQEQFIQTQNFLDLKIPKYIRFISLDEKYLQRCSSIVEFGSLNSSGTIRSPAVPCNIGLNLRSSNKVVLVDNLKLQKTRSYTSDLGSVIIQCPLVDDRPRQWILCTAEGNECVRKGLKGPLLGYLGSLSSPTNLSIAGSIDGKETKSSGFMNLPSQVRISSSQELETESTSSKTKKNRSVSLPKSIGSFSSTKSICSYKSSSSPPASVSQGMLHCTWKSGIPYFIYSVDDQKEVYFANLLKVESSDYRDLDYVYFFRSKTGSLREHGLRGSMLNVVGKMKVSNSFTFSLDNSKIKETEFVLSSVDEKQVADTQSSALNLKKNKGPPKKMNTFSAKSLLKHRSNTKICGESPILEDLLSDPCRHSLNKLSILDEANLLESPPNLELAAVVIEEHIHDDHQEAVVGGWGLKFLEKGRIDRAGSSEEASVSARNCQHQSDFFTSMNVLIPEGYHGGPRTVDGGPSGIAERWRSGGHCDCGGWDVGCPLTILHNKSNKGVWTQANSPEECKSLDFIKEGARQGEAPLKMVNIHEGLYCIHFQSMLSALQSFSIGVAVIHTLSSALNARDVQKLKQQESDN